LKVRDGCRFARSGFDHWMTIRIDGDVTFIEAEVREHHG
jgi:hypothetical protein